MEKATEDPVEALARGRFGLDYLFPYQRLAIANVLDAAAPGGDGDGSLRQLVLLPTGSGKSLCFQLPALLLPGPTLVAYPLLALMEDQRRRLASLGIACSLFRGGMTVEERRSAERAVERGEAKIVITNPECLSAGRLLDFLREARPSHFAVDEAHCVVEWGETFRPAYRDLGTVAEALSPPAMSAFTATAGRAVGEAVAASLFGGSPWRLLEGDPDRPNISYSVARTLSRQRSLERLARELARPLLVFCASREGARILAKLLRSRLHDGRIRFYHAGLDRDEKTETESWFFGSSDGILVSTCAYGMGVDKKNIRSVLHYEAPPSVEAYLQEAGRAGRDGLPARAILISELGEGERPGRDGDVGRERRRREFLAWAAEGQGCRRRGLLRLLGSGYEGEGPCSGCDRCEGKETAAAEGEREIGGLVASQPRRLDAEAARRLLRGVAAANGGGPPRCAGWGSLADWAEADIGSAISLAAKRGIVRVLARGPWKGRLAPAASASFHRRFLFPLRLRASPLRGGRLGRRRRGSRAGTEDRAAVDHAHVAQDRPDAQGEEGDGYDAPIRENAQGDRKVLFQRHPHPPAARGTASKSPYSPRPISAMSAAESPWKASP